MPGSQTVPAQHERAAEQELPSASQAHTPPVHCPVQQSSLPAQAPPLGVQQAPLLHTWSGQQGFDLAQPSPGKPQLTWQMPPAHVSP